jgi:hypothetical protein
MDYMAGLVLSCRHSCDVDGHYDVSCPIAEPLDGLKISNLYRAALFQCDHVEEALPPECLHNVVSFASCIMSSSLRGAFEGTKS